MRRETMGGGIAGDEQRRRRTAISQHQHQEWRTTMYRRANDVSRATREALQKYEWCAMEKDITWPEYMESTNVQARG